MRARLVVFDQVGPETDDQSSVVRNIQGTFKRPPSQIKSQINEDLIASLQPLMTDVDVELFQDDLLAKIEATNATGIVIDISSMDIVDSYMARVLNDTMRMAKLLGTTVVVVGMNPMVALTLVQMGRGLVGVESALTLEMGLTKLDGLRRKNGNS